MLILTDSNFNQEVIKSATPALVDFWAPWCGPCKMMLPIIDELDEEYKNNPIKIAKINIDENEQTPSKYGVMSIPTFIFFKNGKPVDQLMGAQSKKDLKNKIDALLK